MTRWFIIFLLLGVNGAFANIPSHSEINFTSPSLTNRNGKKWQFQFDAANRLTNTISPLLRTNAQTYNNRGLLKTIREPSTQTTTNH